ncbi:MAG: AMP-binding protein, partial [Gammaproteobacteria bacterium]|nr:AMP-binding protein [Gammaproteobacteria bacterium]
MSAPFASVFDAFAAAASVFPGNDFVHVPRQATAGYAGAALTVSYAEAAVRIDGLRNGYRAAGYEGGCRVALALDNRIEFFLHMLALNDLGVSVLPLNVGQSDAEIQHLVRHADAALMVSLPEYAARLGGLSDVPVWDTGPAAVPPHRAVATVALAPGEAAIVYTSGTTGQPKGCMLSNDYFNALGTWYAGLGGHCVLRPGVERLITPLPLSHMNALVASTMGMIHAGGCIIQLDRFHASTWWQSVRESRATCLHYLGVMPAILLNKPAGADDDLGGQIRFGFGAGVDPRHQGAFEQRFGLPLIEGWSMTEVGGAAAISASVEPRYVGERCFGRPLAGMEYRLVGEDGDDAPV